MSRIRFIAASLGTAMAAASAMTLAATGASADGPAPVSAHVWVTTPDGADKLSDLGTVAFSGVPATAPAIVVDPTLTFQTMRGFGGAITDSSAAVLYGLSPAVREATMRSLFDPVAGDGLDYLRQPIGASDFVTTAAYTTISSATSPSRTTRRGSCRCCARPRPSTPGCRSSRPRGARPRG
jgi:glucosylceramidase